MKGVRLAARFLLGLIFLIFGLNGFLHFIKAPPMSGPPAEFFGGLAATGYMMPLIFTAQVAGAILVLAGMVPLGLLVLAPVIVNIVLFHLFLAPEGIVMAIVVAILELYLAWDCREKFAPLFSR